MAGLGESDVPSMLEAVGAEDIEYYDGTRTCFLRGVFNNEFSTLDFPNTVVESSEPHLFIATKFIPNAKHGDRATIRSVVYYVKSVEPDGTGLTRLGLSKDLPQ